MKPGRLIVTLVILANLVLVGWLLVRAPDQPIDSLGDAVSPLVATSTLEGARYDLSNRADELNVILISMDALRYDMTGLGGNGQSVTPNLDQFATESVVFHDAVANAPWTLPSHMSVWTGRWPSVHGVTNKLRLLSQDQMVPTTLSPGIETFPDYLVRGGWKAGGFTGGAGVQGSYGFGRDFDAYLDDRYFAGLDYSIPPALEWLEANRNEQFFLFLHGYDSHGQYPLAEAKLDRLKADYTGDLDGGIEEQAKLREDGLAAITSPGDAPNLEGALDEADIGFLKGVYAQKIKDADERLGGFLAQLRVMGLLDKSIVVIISDHGDEFMEHGGLDHGGTLYQEQLHVVMMMRFPGYARQHDVQESVRLFDVFPTVFDVMGLQGPAGVGGESLLPLLRGEAHSAPVFSESDYRLFVNLRAARRGSKKLVLDLQDGRKELYDLSVDPLEQNDISSADPRTTYELEQALRGWMDQTRTNPEDYLGIQQQPITLF